MPNFTFEKHVAAPLERVFALASDFANAPKTIPEIIRVEMLTPGAVGVGTKFKETRKMFGKEATETMEVTAFDPPRSFTLEADSCGAHVTSNWTFTPDAGGTKLEMSFNAKAVSLFAKLMSPLTFLMSGMMKKCVEGDMTALKKRAEQNPD